MITISVGHAVLTLNERGFVSDFQTNDGTCLLAKGMDAQPFLQIGKNEQMLAPLSCTCGDNTLAFFFEGDCTVNLSWEAKDGYTAFRVESILGDEPDVAIFGPVFSTLTEEIGDVIGVVQGSTWAVGIQALNAKTLPGYPSSYAHTISPLAGNKPISLISVDTLNYGDCAAFSASFDGQDISLIQLYCENRRRTRTKDIMNYTNITVPPMEEQPDAHITGAAFALFCCPREHALEQIGVIEVAEGLPHPMLNGEWAKTSREAMRSYLIAEFRPDNFDNLMEWTKKAGFNTLYHPEPFADWGHFNLRPEHFPEGDDSLADYGKRAQAEGLRLGLHTLSAFTRTNDAYVSPVPDEHLAILGTTVLTADITADDTEIPLEDASVFHQVTSLRTARIGNELIQYAEVKDNKLVGCKRGLWDTPISAHEKNANVSLLCDHPYRVYFPDLKLQEEFSQRLGNLFVKTGAAQISFDGLEGCAATGEDTYGINRFCLDCWETWNRPDVINDASRLVHNLWHMHTRMNWGEPWGAKMREGMIEYRIHNQDFYRRNLFPRMLGWFIIRKADRKFEATTPEDIEWALSMAAGFDAGFALSTSSEVLAANGCSEELFSLIHDWEELRLANAFSKELREKLIDTKTEWHLERTEDGRFNLYPLFISKPYVCDLLELQPGQPGGADWVLDNPYDAQEYDFRMRVEGYGEIHNPALYTRNGMLRFPCTVKGNQYLWYRNGKAVITDRHFQPISEVTPIGSCTVEKGQQSFSFACEFSGEEGPEVTVRVFTHGEPIVVSKPE